MAQNEKKGYFFHNGEPYSPGMVEKYLKNLLVEKENEKGEKVLTMPYECVAGMDEGHGENMICSYSLENITQEPDPNELPVRREPDELPLNSDKEPKIPAFLGYHNGKLIAGTKAKYTPEFFAYFKYPPAKWNKKVDLKGRKIRTLMRDHIKAVWDQTLAQKGNQKLKKAFQDDKVLLAVGCPASNDWMQEDAMASYVKLVKEATGCMHVTILPEPTAAIMAALMERAGDGSLSLENGIAIIDCGSSTLDFTYILLGKRRITCSIRIGGHNIDKLMLLAALQENGMTESDIPKEQGEDALVQMRLYKEEFYKSGLPSLGDRSIHLWGRDEQGIARREIKGDRKLEFTLDEAFMRKALHTIKVLNPEKGNMPNRSWAECFRDFLTNTMGTFSGLPCQKLILTGGTCAVSDVRSIAEEIYGADRIQISPNPAASVARGLCYAKFYELKAAWNYVRIKQEAERISRSWYEAGFLNGLRSYIASVAKDLMAEELNEIASGNEKISYRELIEKLKIRAGQDDRLIGDPFVQKASALYEKYSGFVRDDIRKLVNDFSKELYGTNVSDIPQLPNAGQAQMVQELEKLDLNSLMGKAWLEALIPETVATTLSALLYLLGIVCMWEPWVGLSLIALAALVDSGWEVIRDGLNKINFKLSPKRCKKMAEQLADEDEGQKIVDKAVTRMERKMNKPLEEEFFRNGMEQFELDLGKVLFLVFDDKPGDL